jgi:hypothetical protein
MFQFMILMLHSSGLPRVEGSKTYELSTPSRACSPECSAVLPDQLLSLAYIEKVSAQAISGAIEPAVWVTDDVARLVIQIARNITASRGNVVDYLPIIVVAEDRCWRVCHRFALEIAYEFGEPRRLTGWRWAGTAAR